MTEIAHGSIGIDLNDGEALAGLRRIDAAVERTMSNIERQKATAEVDANIAPFEDRLKRAKAELRRLEGERAEVPVGMDTGSFDKAIINVKRQIKRLDGEKATVEIEYRANEASALAAHKRQMANLAEVAARQKALSRQLNDDHSVALRMDKERTASIRQQTVGVREQEVQVRKLQQQYAKLTDRLENLSRKRPLGREARAKVELDTAGAIAEMELLKAKLNALGRNPPVNIKADLDRSTASRIGEVLRGIVDKASNLSDLTLRLGPFTTSIRGAITALGFLGPTLVDLAGSATSLIGVLGTGLAGATSVAGAAAIGAALNFGGVYAAIKPLAAQFKVLTQLQSAYDKAVLKYGEHSKQAKAAQKQLNEALAGVDPNVRAATKGIQRIRTEWDKLTSATAKRTFGDVIAETVHTAGALLPTLARNTNQTLGIIDTATTRLMQRLRSPGGQRAFSDIGKNFNAGLGPALLGVEHLGAAIGHIAESASRLLEPAAKGFERWAAGLDRATSDGEKLDSTMDRLGQHAKDVGKFFMALGRLMITVLNGSADAGDRLTGNMTDALNRWNDFLKTPQGQQSMATFFDNAAKNADALYHALAPLAANFFKWASGLSTFATGAFRVVGLLDQLITGIGKLTGLGGSLSTLTTTLGAAFAIGKIGAFVSYLSRAADLIREMGAAQGLKTILSGGLGKSLNAQNFAAGGSAAGAEIRSAMVSGGAAAAAEIRAAMGQGGAASGIENAAGSAIGRGGGRAVAGEVAEVGAGTAAGAKGAGLLRTAMTALRGASLLTKASLIGLASFGGFALAKQFMAGKSAADRLRDSFDANGHAAKSAGAAFQTASTGISDTADTLQRSNIQTREAKKALDATKKGTDDHRLALLDYRAALRDNQKARADWILQSQTMVKASATEHTADASRLKQFDQGHAARVQQLRDLIATSHNTNAVKNAEQDLATLMRKRAPLEAAATRSANQQAAAALNVGRAWRGQLPVLGQAAQQLGSLARQRPNLAQNISVKFSSPKDVGQVAREAQNALKAGGSITQVMKIVADSRDAEDALRKLRAMDLPAKTQRILENGGKAAISTLERITGHKLTPKQQRIAQAGGPAVIALLGRILGIKIPPKRVQVNTNANAVQAALSGVQGMINRLTGKTVTITTVHNDVFRGKSVRDSRAAGRGPIGPSTSLVGEGQSGRGATEIIADHATGLMKIVRQPTILNLKSTESVIPTEHAHRSRGSKLLADFAKDMGIPGFAKGKKKKAPKPATPHQLSKSKADARSKVKSSVKHRNYVSDDLVELKTVETRQREESNLRDQVQREASQVDRQEPSSFIKQIGTDAETGDPIYAVDQGLIDGWVAKLNAQAKRFDELVAKIYATQSAVQAAMRRIGDPYGKAGSTSIIGRAEHNEDVLHDLIKREQGITGNRHSSRAARQMAQARIGVYNDALGAEKDTIKNATTDWKSLDNEMNDIGDATRGRLSEAYDSAAQYRDDAGAVEGKANADAASANPDAPKPGKADKTDTPTPLDNAQLAAQALDANDALAAIGQGTASTNAQKIAAQQSIIDAARGQLNDNDPGNDSDAFSAITSAAGAIAQINDSASTAAAAAAAQYTTYGGAISDLTSTMGSNFQAAGAVASAFGGGAQPAFGAGAFGGFGGPPGGAGVAGGVYAPISQTFHQMPDPNTWSKGIAFELQAALS